MNQRVEKKDQTDRSAKRVGGGSWSDWAIVYLLLTLVMGLVLYAITENVENRQTSFSELISRLSVAIPVLLLIRSGMFVGILLGNSLQYIRQEPRSIEQKITLFELAKREGVWYGTAVLSLLFFFRWTPFAGHMDVFFILAIAVPFSLTFIFSLWILIVEKLHSR